MSFVCVICEESLAFRDPAILNGPDKVQYVQINSTLCGHIFHQHCLKDWFQTQVRKLSESHNPLVRGQLHTKTTCPSCQRPVDFAACIRVFPTEDGNESFNVHNNNIKTKAVLTEEINELTKRIAAFKHEKLISDFKFSKTIEDLSQQKETLAIELQKLKVTMNMTMVVRPFRIPSDSQEQEESLDTQEQFQVLDDTQELEESLNHTQELVEVEESDDTHDQEESLNDSSSTEESSPSPQSERLGDLVVTAAAVGPHRQEIETLVVTTGGLTNGDIVVWMREDDNQIGAVLWVGIISGVLSAGIKFINPIGNSSGELNGQKVFSCDINYGRIIAVRELIMYKDFFGTDTSVNYI